MQQGALPHARLLSAHGGDRERRRHAAGDHRGDAAATHAPSARAASSTTTRRPRWSARSRRATSDDRVAAAVAAEHAADDRSQREHKELLRFVTCGSVDDGKSTLIGRLLYERRAPARRPARRRCGPTRKRVGTQGERARLRAARSTASPPSASRASRSTSRTATSRRRGATSSSPTRRATSSTRATWSTGASTRRLRGASSSTRATGVLTQTRRHSHVVALLGIRHVVLAVNKMDLVDYSERALRRDRGRVPRALRERDRPAGRRAASRSRRCAATTSCERSERMPWYDGPPLLEYLETRRDRRAPAPAGTLPTARAVGQPPDSSFRGFSGTDRERQRQPGRTRRRAARRHARPHRADRYVRRRARSARSPASR